MPNEVKLLPCPWCNHTEALEIVPVGGGFNSVHCSGCGAEGPVDNADPKVAWNTRPTTVVAGERQSVGAIPGSREPDPSCTGSGPSGFDPERIEALLRSLLKGEFTSLTIGFNDLHACNYQTAAQWSEQMGEPDGGMQTYNDPRDWVSPEERERALASNSVWSAQWYPDTPVGFCQLYASSLGPLLDAIATEARRAETENTGSVHEGAGPQDIAQ